ERCLHAHRQPLRASVDRQVAEPSGQVRGEPPIVGRPSCRPQELECDRRAKEHIALFDHGLPAWRLRAAVPGARVGEIRRHYGSRSRRSSSGVGPIPPRLRTYSFSCRLASRRSTSSSAASTVCAIVFVPRTLFAFATFSRSMTSEV